MFLLCQAASALQYGDKRLSSTSSATQESSLLSLWRRNLSMILANKGPDWRALVVALGDRLLKEVRDVDSAHFAYLCSGLLPFTNSSSNSNGSSSNSSTSFGLLGLEVNSHDGKKRAVTLSDCPSLFALRLTEILEWTLSKEKESTDSAVVASSGVGSSLSKSLGGLFGLGVAIDKEKTSASAPSGVDARVLAMRSVLCPLKVRWALLLADYGDIKGAGAYAREAKGLIGMCLDKQSASNSKAGKGQNQAPSRSVHVPSFCRQLVFSLEEFLDRLGGFEGKQEYAQGIIYLLSYHILFLLFAFIIIYIAINLMFSSAIYHTSFICVQAQLTFFSFPLLYFLVCFYNALNDR